MKCRVFTLNLGWSEAMYIFDISTKFSEIKNNLSTSNLSKEDYVGTYDFDKNFINFFDKKQIGNKLYFYRHCYDKDNNKITKTKTKTKIDNKINDDGSFDDFNSLF